jgi:isoquinoline 1-oxidoreductase beta subunit
MRSSAPEISWAAAGSRFSQRSGVVARRHVGDRQSLGERRSDGRGSYEAPFLAHATMEPVNCTSTLPGGCDVWESGPRGATFAQTAAAKVTGLPPGQSPRA